MSQRPTFARSCTPPEEAPGTGACLAALRGRRGGRDRHEDRRPVRGIQELDAKRTYLLTRPQQSPPLAQMCQLRWMLTHAPLSANLSLAASATGSSSALCARSKSKSIYLIRSVLESNGGASSSPATTRCGSLSAWAIARRRRRGPMPSGGPHESPGAAPPDNRSGSRIDLEGGGAISGGNPPTAFSPSAQECPGNGVGYKSSFPRTTVLGYGRPSRSTRTPSSR